jgi:hypothetical protein
VAPLAATLALMGAGVAAAAVVRRRRGIDAFGDARPREDAPSHGDTQSTDAQIQHSLLQRKTTEQLDLAIALLEGRGEQSREQTVHEARKALKRARALVRLQRDALGKKRFAAMNAALRNVGRGLARARDAEVMVDALDGLVQRNPKQLKSSAAVASLRRELVLQRERLHAQTREGAPARAALVVELRSVRERFVHWQPPAGRDRVRMERAGLERIYRQGRRRRARARKAGDSLAMHQWRKRVKDLRYAAEALGLRKLARRADRLGETIGEEHDLVLLAEHVQRHRNCFAGEQATRKALKQAIGRRRKRLRARAWYLGDGLYSRKPKRFVRRAMAKSIRS